MQNQIVTKSEILRNNGCPIYNQYQGEYPRLLFVCSGGLLRSPTAAAVGTTCGFNTRSCGSDLRLALVPISYTLVQWADQIIFMQDENKHQAYEIFRDCLEIIEKLQQRSIVWPVPDNYDYMDKMLVRLVKDMYNTTFGTIL